MCSSDLGKTLRTILSHLRAIGYNVSYAVLNSKYFGVPQERKRIYIVGTFGNAIPLDGFPVERRTLAGVLEQGLPTMDTAFTRLLLRRFDIAQLPGKSIKDKRGGKNNIHSWDIDVKGPTTVQERDFLNILLKERRKRKWADMYGIDWMDGMPLTKEMIATFYDRRDLDTLLDSLTAKGYLVYEHPKKKVKVKNEAGQEVSRRQYDEIGRASCRKECGS